MDNTHLTILAIATAILICLGAAVGCGDQGLDNSSTVQSTCKAQIQGEDGVNATASGATVTIKHVDAWYNCAAKVRLDSGIFGPVISVYEVVTNPGEEPDCYCTYDLKVEVKDVPAGNYEVRVYKATGELAGTAKVTVQAAAAGGSSAESVKGSTSCGPWPGGECGKSQVCDIKSCAVGAGGVCVPKVNNCLRNWDPVCGCDGKTYPNDCVRLRDSGVALAYKGECKLSPPATDGYDPKTGCKWTVTSVGVTRKADGALDDRVLLKGNFPVSAPSMIERPSFYVNSFFQGESKFYDGTSRAITGAGYLNKSDRNIVHLRFFKPQCHIYLHSYTFAFDPASVPAGQTVWF